jgi:hypothetical protein
MTVSMTWMMPLSASMSATTTVAFLTSNPSKQSILMGAHCLKIGILTTAQSVGVLGAQGFAPFQNVAASAHGVRNL